MKRIWMNVVYRNICDNYLVKSRPDRDVDMMEKVLFLMQMECLKKGIKPLLEYKIYLYDNTIRIRYLSDLLRISPKTVTFGYREGMFLINAHNFDEYSHMLNRYRRLSREELHERVEQLLKSETFDEAYVVFEPYDDGFARVSARLKINSTKHYLLNFLRYLLAMLLPATILGYWKAVPMAKEVGIPIDYTVFFALILMASACFLIALGLTLRWLKPTQFELDTKETDEKARRKEK